MPSFFQISSSLSFLAMVTFTIGLSAAFGLSNPQTITSKMPFFVYPTYGAGVALASVALMYGIVTRDFLTEKFAARILAMCLGTFAIWAVAANGIQRSIVTMGLISVIVFLLEQRISLINCLLQAKVISYRFEQSKLDEEREDE